MPSPSERIQSPSDGIIVRRPKTFSGQFVISAAGQGRPALVPGAFEHRRNAALDCWTCPTLGVIPIQDRHNATVGCILGEPIDLETAQFLRQPVSLDAGTASDLDPAIETLFERLGGSFVIVIDGFDQSHIYLDACGSKSLVFDPKTKTAAATTGLLLDAHAYVGRFRGDLYQRLNILRDGWFPAGLTAHHGIVRQLVNHRLDFATMTQARHWPTHQIAIGEAPEKTVDIICRATRASIDAMRKDGQVTFGLTAGNESRMLLALCRDVAHEINFATVNGPESGLDMVRAEELSAKYNLSHQRLPIVQATHDEAWDWHSLTSHCMGGGNMWTHASARPMAGNGFFAGGLGGEIGRAFFWRAGDTAETEVDAKTIVGRFGMPADDTVVQAVSQWFPSLDGFDPFLKLDLAYLELRMGCWAFAQAYTMPEVHHTNPMISRRSFAAMLALPPSWRRGQLMTHEAILQNWPELLDLPINKYGDYRDTLRLVGRAVRNPHLVVKKARKIFA